MGNIQFSSTVSSYWVWKFHLFCIFSYRDSLENFVLKLFDFLKLCFIFKRRIKGITYF